MNWSCLLLVSRLWVRWAAIVLTAVPVALRAIDCLSMSASSLDLQKFMEVLARAAYTYRVSLIGAAIYMVAGVIVRSCAPLVQREFRTERQYQDSCRARASVMVPEIEFAIATEVHGDALAILFPEKRHYLPMERAIEMASRQEFATVYASICYSLHNRSRATCRWVLSVAVGGGALCLLWPLLHRICLAILGTNNVI